MAFDESDSSMADDRSGWLRSVEAFVKEARADTLDLRSREIKAKEAKSILTFLIGSEIKKLNLASNRLEDGMKSLSKLLSKTKLEVLNISSCYLTNEDLLHLMKAISSTRIVDLDLSENQLDLDSKSAEKFISYLLKSRLTTLNLGHNSFDPPEETLLLTKSLQNTQITHLNLRRTSLPTDVVTSLFSNLRHTLIIDLNLSDNQITSGQLEELSQTLKDSKVEKLNLSENEIDDDGMDILARGLVNSKVIELDLRNNNFRGSNSLGEHLCNSQIKVLNLGGNGIDQNKMFSFPNFLTGSSINELDLGGCNLSEGISLELMKCFKASSVKKLVLRENNLQLPCITELAKVVKHTNITDIDLSNNDFQPSVYDVLGDCLKDSKFKHIDLSNNFKHPVGDIVLADFLRKTKGTSINSVKMNFNELMSYGAESVAPSLVDTQFTYFDLSSNWIEDGVSILADNLKFTAITHLDISNNKIEDDGAEAIARCLKDTKLIDLNISTNSITDRGAKAIAQSLKGTSLLFLQVEENEIENDGLKSLAKQIENTYITVLAVNSNPADTDLSLLVDSVLWKNRKSAERLISSFKQLASGTTNDPLGFERGTSITNVSAFLEECLFMYKTIKEQSCAVNVLLHNKTSPFLSSQIQKFLSEFPQQFVSFIGSRVEADVTNHIDLLKKAEEMELKNIVELLLLNRPMYIIDKDQGILHPYVYILLHRYNQPLYNLAIEPRGKEKIIKYFTKHANLEGASEVIRILKSMK